MKKFIRIFLCFLLTALFYGCAAKGPQIKIDTASGEKENVYFAGFSFVGASSDIEAAYPYTSEIIKEKNADGASVLRELYNDIAKAVDSDYINIVKNKNGEFAKAQDTGDKLVTIAVALDRERVSFIRMPDGNYKIVTQLSGQIIAMDFNSSALIATVPLDTIYIDVSEKAPSGADIAGDIQKKLVRKVLFENFANEFRDKLKKIRIKKTYNNRIGINKVILGEKSLKRIGESGEKPEIYKSRVAGAFARSISDKLFVPVLPYAADNTAGTMFLALENASRELTIPSADYEINLTVQGYNAAVSAPSGPSRAASFVSYFNISAAVAGDNPPFLNGNFVGIATAKIPASVGLGDLDVWTSLFDSTRELADGFAENIYSASSKWLNSSLRKGQDKKAVKKGLRELAEVLDKCR